MEHFSSEANFTQPTEDWSLPIARMVKQAQYYVYVAGMPHNDMGQEIIWNNPNRLRWVAQITL